jgi:ferredoxin
MKIVLNTTRCEGYGFCQERAPGLMELDDDGNLHILVEHVEGSDLEQAQQSVRSCPVAALTLSDAP